MQKMIDDETLLTVFKRTGSPQETGEALGLSSRSVARRLRSLGVPPLPTRPIGGPRPLQLAHGKINATLDTGTLIAFSDAHYAPGTVTTAHRALLILIKRLRPSIIVCNGDAFDGGAISRYPRIGWDKRPTVAQDLEAVEARLTEIEKIAKGAQLIWPLGNHDARFETFLASNVPQYEGVQGFSLKDRFPLWKPCWGLWVNDTVVFKHRYKGGIHATHNNTLNAGTTIVTGHDHMLKITPFSDYKELRWGVSLGTLAEPYDSQFVDYTELSPVNWQSGFVVFTFHNGRLLWPEPVHVLSEGLVFFRGEIISC